MARASAVAMLAVSLLFALHIYIRSDSHILVLAVSLVLVLIYEALEVVDNTIVRGSGLILTEHDALQNTLLRLRTHRSCLTSPSRAYTHVCREPRP